MFYEQKKVGNGVVGEGQGEEDDARVNDVAQNVNCAAGREIEARNGLQISQQQAQGPIIRWERFLPKRSLKVLLVENDDSTRHVVSVLLRNCSYEVTAVSNGLQAWRILEDLTNPTDLVLTEVVMPFVSGISLLYKIMSHETLKNVPVIMMSSHDSMGLVFKCLSKGAVDFLVKPIRKNELKNLWQHVWRRCHSSSGSGSESGIHPKKSTQSRSNEVSDNNIGGSDEQDNGSLGLNIGDGSDNRSGTQSSWTKRAAEIDSPRLVSLWDQSADVPDICAQVIDTEPETVSNNCLHVPETKDCQEQDEEFELDMRVSGNSDLQVKYPQVELSAHQISKSHINVSEVDGKPLERGLPEPDNKNLSGNLNDQTISKNNTIMKSNPNAESRTFGAPSSLSIISEPKKVKANCDSRELPSLELTLTRSKGGGDVGVTLDDYRNILNHSDLSAFSKYSTTSSANEGPSGNVGSCSPLDNSSIAIKTETMQNFQSQSNNTPLNQQSNESSNNNDMASTKYVNLMKEALNDKLESVSAFKCYYSSAFQPVQTDCVYSPQQIIPGKSDDMAVDKIQMKSKVSQQQFKVQHHHHYYHHIHHHVHKLQSDSVNRSEKSGRETAPQCGSSNAYGGPIDGNTGNYSVNGSASGSNRGSNGQHGSSIALNAEVNIESDNVAVRNSGLGGISGRIGATGMDEDRAAQREAALTKFRQKRKDRCFEKKVRYQSRKRLAEQQARVRGQFVRKMVSDAKTAKGEQSNELIEEDNSCHSVQ